MKLSSAQLEAFHAIAKFRSFTKAAAHLHIGQSALSQRVLNLEADLATTLFIRDRSGVELTPVAQELLKYCKLQESFEEEFLGRLKSKKPNELAGVIRVAGFSSIMRSMITPGLAKIILKHPRTELQAQTKELHELIQLFRGGQADYILLDHELKGDGIESIQLGLERYVLVQSKKHPVPDVYLDHDEMDKTTRHYLEMAGKDQKIRRHFLDDIYGIIDGVKAGLGKAVLPEHLISDLKDVEIKNPRMALEVPVYLHFHKQPFYTQLHEVIVKELVKEAKILAAPV